MVQKQRLPITFFERFYDIVTVIMPEFFKAPVPDLIKLKKIHDDLSREDIHALKSRLADKPKSFIVALKELHGLFRDLYQQRIDVHTKAQEIVTSLLDRMKKSEEEPGILEASLEEEEMDDVFDELYKYGVWLETKKGETTKNGGRVHRIVDLTLENIHIYDALLDRVFWTMHRFNARGKKVFRFEEQVMHELFLTDTGKVSSDFLRLPYPAICFHIPYNNKLTMRGELVEWVYLTERLLVGIEGLNGEKTPRRIEFTFVSKNDQLWNYYIDILETDIDNLISQDYQDMNKFSRSKLAQRELSEMNNFLMAAILYMNSKDAVHTNIFPNVFAKKQDSRFPVCSIGYGIKVNKDLHYYKPSGDKAETDRHMQVLKWTVRGHFRHYTSDRYEKKVIWIRPYLKGRERDNTEQKEKPTHYDVG